MKRASLSRIHELDRLIRLGRLRSAEEAARQFEVSRRTIERDLEELRLLGADLRYNRSAGAYEYADASVTLPAQWLNEREPALILVADRALRVFTNTSFADQVHPAFNKLLDPIRHDRRMLDYIHDLCNSVHFHRPVRSGRDLRREFSVVLDAIMQQRRMSMVYHTSGRVSRQRREVDPYALVDSGGDWYLVGSCRRHREVRTFALAQVFDARVEELHFAMPDDFDVHEYFGQGFGRMRGNTAAARIRLRIEPPAAGWVGRSVWHPSQKTCAEPDGGLTLTMKCPVTDSLVRWVLQMGECVRVEAPSELRQLVAAKACALLRRHADTP